MSKKSNKIMTVEELRYMPKVELHTHLDGFAEKQVIDEYYGKGTYDQLINRKPKNLAEYLTAFPVILGVLQNEEGLARQTIALTDHLLADGIIYAEVRFCPLLHLEGGLDPKQVIYTVVHNLKRQTKIETNLILCMMRDFTFEQNMEIARLAAEGLGHGICAVDLAGDEATHPNSEFKQLFAAVRELGVPMTIHAGEADTPQGIIDAIDGGAERIGHGIHAVDNPDVMKLLADKKIPLEICPSSNIRTGAYADIASLPIRKLMDAEVPVTINTDNRTVSNTSLTHEYELLQKYAGFTRWDFWTININAIRGSFLPIDDQVFMLKLVTDSYARDTNSLFSKFMYWLLEMIDK